jgi:ribosomal protein S17E
MGKIKLKAVRKAVATLIKKDVEFSENFEKNKHILNNLSVGKKIRNQMAGLATRTKRNEKKLLKTK